MGDKKAQERIAQRGQLDRPELGEMKKQLAILLAKFDGFTWEEVKRLEEEWIADTGIAGGGLMVEEPLETQDGYLQRADQILALIVPQDCDTCTYKRCALAQMED